MDVLDNINYLFDRDDLIVDNDQVRVESSAHHCLSLFESVSSSSIFTSLQQYAKTCFPKMKDTIVLGTPTITTWSHSDGFSELERLVGSIHSRLSKRDPVERDEPYYLEDWIEWTSDKISDNRPIVVFDMGLTSAQVKMVQSWENVYLVPFPFKLLPKHLTRDGNVSWKSLLIYLALQQLPSIIFIDTKYELVGNFGAIDSEMLESGKFLVKDGKQINLQGEIPSKIVNLLDIKSRDASCNHGVVGISKNSQAYDKVIIPLSKCALEEFCILNDEQYRTLFSSLTKKTDMRCESVPNFWENTLISSRRVPDSTAIIQKKKFALVIPFTENQSEKLVKAIQNWGKVKYAPCDDSLESRGFGGKADLIFYTNRNENLEINSLLKKTILSLSGIKGENPILKCFSKVAVIYAKLPDHQDAYPYGPSNQFYKLIFSPIIYETYEYFMYMEPDCVPIRPNWVTAILSTTETQKEAKPGFWVLGSVFRGSLVLETPVLRFHINGNAIYSTSQAYRSVLDRVRAVHLNAFDVDIINFILNDEKEHATKQYVDKFVFHEIIQNYYHSAWSENFLREKFPRTFLIHGGEQTDKES